MHDLIGPDVRNSVFAHIVHLLLIGGVIVYGWQLISALTRKPTSLFRALRKGVYAAWLGILLLVLTRENPLPYLRAGAFIGSTLFAFWLWDRLSSKAPEATPEKQIAHL